MSKPFLYAILYVACFATFSNGSDQNTTLDVRVRAAISKALPKLESGSKGSADKRQCFTCHSQAIPVFALIEAKRLGFQIDDENLNRQVKHSYEHLKRGLANYLQGKGQGGDILTAGYALWTLDEASWEADEVTEAVSNYLLNTQKDLAHWRHRGSRPPTSGSDYTATYVALRALHYFGTDDQKVPIADRRQQIAKWLYSTEPVETEDLVFRLRSLPYLDSEPQAIAESANALLKLQHDNGGWGQKEDMLSDAYATGSALSALVRDGNIPSDNPSIQKGIEYLLSSQLDDGTWHVVTRATPVQEYFESDFPHGKDQFISISATAWSTLALLQTLSVAPKESEHEPVLDNGKVDALMHEFMAKHKVPGASIAITNHGKIVYSKGFGYSEIESQTAVSSASVFRIASLSKPITAVAIMQLVEKSKLGLDDKVFSILELGTRTEDLGSSIDPRFKDITIEHLLQHRGGWDRDKSFDPMFQSVRFANQLGTVPPAGQDAVIRAMLGQKLDFDPGSRFAYSNFGYCLLGRVIEKISGETYERYVQSNVLLPLGIRTMRIGATRLEGRGTDEVRYYDSKFAKSVFQADLDQDVSSPYGAWHLEAMDSHGGWVATADDIARFAAALDDLDHCSILSRASIERMHARPMGLAGYNESGEPTESFYSLGWLNRVSTKGQLNHWHTGSLPGTSAIMIRRWDGLNMVALMNTRDSQHAQHLGKEIDQLLHKAANVCLTHSSDNAH